MADQTKTGENTTNDERAQRRARRQALIDEGVNPYPIASEVTAHAAQLEKDYSDLPDGEDTQDVASVAGRIRALRRQGKAAFIVLEDVSGQIQLFCRVNDLGEEGWGLLRQLDLGDIVNATVSTPPDAFCAPAVVSSPLRPPSSCSSPSPCARCPRSSTASPIARSATASVTLTSS